MAHQKPAALIIAALAGVLLLAAPGCTAVDVATLIEKCSSFDGLKELAAAEGAANPDNAATAAQLYIWGYPTITWGEFCSGYPAEINGFANSPKLMFASFVDDVYGVRAPNADTLYGVAWTDLTRNPVVLTKPAIPGRMFALQCIDVYSNSPWAIRSDEFGPDANTFLILPPRYNGRLPPEFSSPDRKKFIFQAPTNAILLLPRFQIFNGSEEELAEVRALQAQLKLQPAFKSLNAFINGQSPTNMMNACVWARSLGQMSDMAFAHPDMMKPTFGAPLLYGLIAGMSNAIPPPNFAEKSMVAGWFSKLGMRAQSGFMQPYTLTDLAALNSGYQLATQCIQAVGDYGSLGCYAPDGSTWTMAPSANFGNNYLQRAAVTYKVWGINPISTTVYLVNTRDKDGDLLDITKSYTIKFPAADVNNYTAAGPARHFYSVTVYRQKDALFVNGPDEPDNPVFNPAKRAGINFQIMWPSLVKDPEDGSVTVFISPNPPADEAMRPNWIPSGNRDIDGQNIFLTIRLYGPSVAAQTCNYRPPDVLKAA